MINFDDTKQRLLKLDTACICDADKILNLNLRVMDSGMRPIRTGLKLIGCAHTVTCHNDFLTVVKALRDATPGEVIVIDSQNSHKALTGELFPTEAARKGLAGIVNDGPCRDTAVVRTMEIPCYARSVSCVPGTTNQLFATQIPITCGSITVNPGDILFGDDDGVVVATIEELDILIPEAEDIQRREDRLLKGMADGVSLLEMLNFEEHCSNICNGKESQLKFQV